MTIASTREGRAPSGAARLDRDPDRQAALWGEGSRLGTVLAAVGAGLVVQAVGYALSRSGRASIGLDLFFVGVAVVFAACAWRLLGAGAQRRERLGVAIVLGVALVISSYLASPLLFDTYDEMLHETTLWQLADLRRLFTSNSVLPVGPYYPGFELLTVAVKWLTGLPSVAAELLVVLASRLVVVVALFLFAERVTRSHRAAGFAVLVYACSPQFYAFNSAYSYQTLALAFGAATITFLLLGVESSEPRVRRGYGLLSLAAMAATTVTHHVIGWLTLAGLLVWAVVATLEARRDRSCLPRAHLVRNVAAGSLVVSAAWTGFTAPKVLPYLSPIVGDASSAFSQLFSHLGQHRALFHSASGAVTPRWQEALVVVSVLMTLVVLGLGLWNVVVRRGLPGRAERLLPVAVCLGYVLVLASPLEGGSSQIGQRASTFVFFGIALVGASWFGRRRTGLPIVAVVVVATAAFLGSLVFGSGPSWSYVPGPYIPVADQRSVDAPSIAAANWASTHLPVDARIAADRDNSVLMAAVGHLSPVTEADKEVNVGLMYFDPHFGRYEAGVIRRFRIRYLLVDQRLRYGPPAFGVYFEPGAPAPKDYNRLTKNELNKFSKVAGIRRVYDNGPIQIYDTAGLIGTNKPATPIRPIGRAGGGANLWVLVPAAVVAGAWLVRSRRRPRQVATEVGLAYLTGAMIVAIAAMFAFVPTGLDSVPLAWAVLAVLLGLCIKGVVSDRRARAIPEGAGGPATGGAPPEGLSRSQRWLAGLGAAGLVVAVVVAVISAGTDFRTVSSLSVANQAGRAPVANVSLAAPARTSASLEVLAGSRVAWSKRVGDVAVQRVTLPRAAVRPGAEVVLLVHARRTLEVAG